MIRHELQRHERWREQLEADNKAAWSIVETHEARVKELGADKMRTGSSIFRTMFEAKKYYGIYGYTVDDKIASKEISIQPYPTRKGEWDDDGRWIYTEHPLLDDARAAVSESRFALCKTLENLKLADRMIYDLRRMLLVQPVVVEKPTVERLRELTIQVNWTEELPYCCEGRPHYYAHTFDAELQKPGNVRVFQIGRAFLGYLRELNGSTDTHWGMSDRKASLLVVKPGNRVYATSVQDAFDIITEP